MFAYLIFLNRWMSHKVEHLGREVIIVTRRAQFTVIGERECVLLKI